MKKCQEDCLSCKGGAAYDWLADDKDEDSPCVVCGGVPDVDARCRRLALVDVRLTELRNILRLYSKQALLDDPFRGFNLDRARRLVNELAEIDVAASASFYGTSKKLKIEAKITKNGPGPSSLP